MRREPLKSDPWAKAASPSATAAAEPAGKEDIMLDIYE